MKKVACNFRGVGGGGGHFPELKRGKFPSFSLSSLEKSTQKSNYVIAEIYYIAHPMKSSRIMQSLLL